MYCTGSLSQKQRVTSAGFTLVETLVGVAVFSVVAWSAYSSFAAIFEALTVLRHRGAAANLANEQFEILRNMPYTSVGIVGGLPAGAFEQERILVRDGIEFFVEATIRNVDLPQDGTVGGTPNDTSPADAKFVEIVVSCADCRMGSPITVSGRVSPKGVESMNNEGAIYVRVVDSAGAPIDSATVTIERVISGTSIDVTDVTDSNGEYMLVGVPTGTAGYRVSATKDGYSIASTYPATAQNPSPNPQDATVVAGQVTNLTFVIDRLSDLTIRTVNAGCAAVSDFDFTLLGSKTIGTNVPKYSQQFNTGAGTIEVTGLEWDSYSFVSNDSSHVIAGTIPVSPFALPPDAAGEADIVLSSYASPALLVTVVDGIGEPVADAEVGIFRSNATTTSATGRGATTQTNWNGGSGQDDIGSMTRYFQSDGDISTPNGSLQLRRSGGTYATEGWLESSTFDMGTSTDFATISWLPGTQDSRLGTNPVRMQVATNLEVTATSTWSFVGPDGTSSSYYTTPGLSLHSSHDGDRYLRYRIFLSRSTQNRTPTISDVSFSYSSECSPPGQALFTGISSGSTRVTVSRPGYVTSVQTINVASGWNSLVVTLGQ